MEFLIWIGLFAAMLVLNALMQRAAARRRPPPPQDEIQAPAPAADLPTAAELWRQLRTITNGPAPRASARSLEAGAPPREWSREQVERRPPRPPAGPARRHRYTRRELLGSRRDLRQAIVLMTVLGPCRGAETPAQAPARGEPPPI